MTMDTVEDRSMAIEQDELSKKLAAAAELEDYNLKRRVEVAAIAIFAGMQANPNWSGSNTGQWEAVNMARFLIQQIDMHYRG